MAFKDCRNWFLVIQVCLKFFWSELERPIFKKKSFYQGDPDKLPKEIILKRAADIAEALYSMPRSPSGTSSSFNSYSGQLAVTVQPDANSQWTESKKKISFDLWFLRKNFQLMNIVELKVQVLVPEVTAIQAHQHLTLLEVQEDMELLSTVMVLPFQEYHLPFRLLMFSILLLVSLFY
jgi:hypothetical protein